MSSVREGARERSDNGRISAAVTLGMYCVFSAIFGVVLAVGALKVIDMLHVFD